LYLFIATTCLGLTDCFYLPSLTSFKQPWNAGCPKTNRASHSNEARFETTGYSYFLHNYPKVSIIFNFLPNYLSPLNQYVLREVKKNHKLQGTGFPDGLVQSFLTPRSELTDDLKDYEVNFTRPFPPRSGPFSTLCSLSSWQGAAVAIIAFASGCETALPPQSAATLLKTAMPSPTPSSFSEREIR